MSTAAAKQSFFSIYKPGQGKWLRWGTVGAAALVAGLGGIWLVQGQNEIRALPILWQTVAELIWLAVLALITFWFVNSPKYGEFLIMTESEMRKVTWPSRREVINSVKIVIILTAVLGMLLYLVDLGFIQLFQWIGIE